MKYLITAFISIFCFLCSTAQPAKKIKSKNPVFNKVEQEAVFPGGDPAWRKFLEKTLNPSIPLDNGAPAGSYTVIVQFIVSKDGDISDVTALTNHGYGMEGECVKAIKKSGKWKPAQQNGRPVNAYRKQPFTFQIAEETDKQGEDDSDQYSKDTIGAFTYVEQEAEFPGQLNGWRTFLEKNLNAEVGIYAYNDTAYFQKYDPATYQDMKSQKTRQTRAVTAMAQFIVCKDGSLCEIEVINNVHPLIKKEVERVIKKSPNWIPAQKHGRQVKAYRRQPITFIIDEN